MIFPWQTEQWQQLWQAKCKNRLSHALLFAGMPGTGKTQFAGEFTQTLLCQNISLRSLDAFFASGIIPGSVPESKKRIQATQEEWQFHCDSCHSCRLITTRVHPNVLWVEPEKAGQAIKIDQIRPVNEFISQSSLQGDYRVVIINPANNMNTNAANALLKTLEEPSSGALIILISDQSAQLPATILSRCQRVNFPRPQREYALAWLKDNLTDAKLDAELLLQLANGAPLAALRLVRDEILSVRQNLFSSLYLLGSKQGDPIKLAVTLQNNDPLMLLDFILTWLMDLLRLQLNGDDSCIINKDYTTQLTELKTSTQIKNNTKLMVYLQQLRGQICEGINLNKQLMLETILIRWCEVLK